MIYEAKQVQRLINKMKALEIPYLSLLFEDITKLKCMRFDTETHYRDVPQDADWQSINDGDQWGGPFQTMWLNTFYMAEDVPFIYDNWDIDSDITLNHHPVDVYETNMLEKPVKKLNLADSAVEVSFRAFEIKTLLVK